MVVLEGLCRFSVQELSTKGTYCTAKITPLEIAKAGDVLIHISLRLICVMQQLYSYFISSISV